jgi:hypothetical protein
MRKGQIEHPKIEGTWTEPINAITKSQPQHWNSELEQNCNPSHPKRHIQEGEGAKDTAATQYEDLGFSAE